MDLESLLSLTNYWQVLIDNNGVHVPFINQTQTREIPVEYQSDEINVQNLLRTSRLEPVYSFLRIVGNKSENKL